MRLTDHRCIHKCRKRDINMIIGICILTIVGLLAIFSVQNVTSVSVSLLHWRFETSLPMLVFVAVLIGVVAEQLIRKWIARRNAKVSKS